MSINKTGNWRSDFNWMDKDDVQLDVLKNNSMIEEGELSPDNAEACELMSAFRDSISLKCEKAYDLDVDMDEELLSSGIGKDIFGKYAFDEIEHKGKTYQIHLREKSAYDNATAIAQSRIIGPKVIRMKKGMN